MIKHSKYESFQIINELSVNSIVFKDLLTDIPEEARLWKPSPDKWCVLEIICHLYDIEREDFRARTKHALENSAQLLPPVDPKGWVKSRQYLQQDYRDTLNRFLTERARSIEWLRSLGNPNWDNAEEHPKFGKMTAKTFLSNWLAHDYLHIRQIIKLKYDYLKQLTNEDLNYAGNW